MPQAWQTSDSAGPAIVVLLVIDCGQVLWTARWLPGVLNVTVEADGYASS